jgi:hypothetical protein
MVVGSTRGMKNGEDYFAPFISRTWARAASCMNLVALGGCVRVPGEGVDVDRFRHREGIVGGIDAGGRAGGVDEADGDGRALGISPAWAKFTLSK